MLLIAACYCWFLLNLLNPTTSELESLSAACDRVTFGVNQEAVLDVKYRKAGKLDLEHFSLNFSPHELGFESIVKKALLTPDERRIRFERYKLNVYGTYTDVWYSVLMTQVLDDRQRFFLQVSQGYT